MRACPIGYSIYLSIRREKRFMFALSFGCVYAPISIGIRSPVQAYTQDDIGHGYHSYYIIYCILCDMKRLFLFIIFFGESSGNMAKKKISRTLYRKEHPMMMMTMSTAKQKFFSVVG